uniref:Uncharacterized protein n=1 Tax=Trichobilharzia regenti TaxID=157069 RepID=A0AA85JKJ0_TRIRE|nr:unnamed protein product [Trichobilharzia regenti]
MSASLRKKLNSHWARSVPNKQIAHQLLRVTPFIYGACRSVSDKTAYCDLNEPFAVLYGPANEHIRIYDGSLWITAEFISYKRDPLPKCTRRIRAADSCFFLIRLLSFSFQFSEEKQEYVAAIQSFTVIQEFHTDSNVFSSMIEVTRAINDRKESQTHSKSLTIKTPSRKKCDASINKCDPSGPCSSANSSSAAQPLTVVQVQQNPPIAVDKLPGVFAVEKPENYVEPHIPEADNKENIPCEDKSSLKTPEDLSFFDDFFNDSFDISEFCNWNEILSDVHDNDHNKQSQGNKPDNGAPNDEAYSSGTQYYSLPEECSNWATTEPVVLESSIQGNKPDNGAPNDEADSSGTQYYSLPEGCQRATCKTMNLGSFPKQHHLSGENVRVKCKLNIAKCSNWATTEPVVLESSIQGNKPDNGAPNDEADSSGTQYYSLPEECSNWATTEPVVLESSIQGNKPDNGAPNDEADSSGTQYYSLPEECSNWATTEPVVLESSIQFHQEFKRKSCRNKNTSTGNISAGDENEFHQEFKRKSCRNKNTSTGNISAGDENEFHQEFKRKSCRNKNTSTGNISAGDENEFHQEFKRKSCRNKNTSTGNISAGDENEFHQEFKRKSCRNKNTSTGNISAGDENEFHQEFKRKSCRNKNTSTGNISAGDENEFHQEFKRKSCRNKNTSTGNISAGDENEFHQEFKRKSCRNKNTSTGNISAGDENEFHQEFKRKSCRNKNTSTGNISAGDENETLRGLENSNESSTEDVANIVLLRMLNKEELEIFTCFHQEFKRKSCRNKNTSTGNISAGDENEFHQEFKRKSCRNKNTSTGNISAGDENELIANCLRGSLQDRYKTLTRVRKRIPLKEVNISQERNTLRGLENSNESSTEDVANIVLLRMLNKEELEIFTCFHQEFKRKSCRNKNTSTGNISAGDENEFHQEFKRKSCRNKNTSTGNISAGDENELIANCLRGSLQDRYKTLTRVRKRIPLKEVNISQERNVSLFIGCVKCLSTSFNCI